MTATASSRSPRQPLLVLWAVSLLGMSLPAMGASSASCPALGPPAGSVVHVATVPGLVAAVASATPGMTILLADGTYAMDGAYLRIETPNVTLRSESGNREAVVLDGNYATTEIVQVVASDVTVADITLLRAYDHPIHVMSSSEAGTTGTLIYNVHIVDPGQQAIKINPVDATHFVDEGVVACSRIELTAAGRAHVRDSCYTGGVDAHAARAWVVRDNEIEGFWCEAGLSEHAIHFWNACRDTRVERNHLRNDARGVGFGMREEGTGRLYPDHPCPEAAGGYVDHYGGEVVNNFISADDPGLFASEYGFDCGLCLWQACGSRVLHNTVHTSDAAGTFSSIEWRFARTSVEITNNLVNHTMRERDGAQAVQAGNVTSADASWYVAPSTGDLHLVAAAGPAIDQAVPTSVTDDIDGDARPVGTASDVGADEVVASLALTIDDVSVAETDAGGTALVTVTLSESPGATTAEQTETAH